MITEYHRPETIQEALNLLAPALEEQTFGGENHSRAGRMTRPLGGGTVINRPSRDNFAVVDLQRLGLDTIERHGNSLHLGAMVTLQKLIEFIDQYPTEEAKSSEASKPEVMMPWSLRSPILQETTYNLRQMATLAGTLVAANGRSSLAAAFLALEADLLILSRESQPQEEKISYGELLPMRVEKLPGRLISQVELPLNVRLATASVARTPADLPLIFAAVAAWPSGRLRVALGGYGDAPKLVFDGMESAGAEIAARSAFLTAGDEWASAEYRSEIASVLVKRCIAQVG